MSADRDSLGRRKPPRTQGHNAAIGVALRRRGVGNSATKVCPRCKVELPRSAFVSRSNGHTKSYCAPCDKEYARIRQKANRDAHPERGAKRKEWNRKATLKRSYGMTPARYGEMFLSQGGGCAICHGPPTGNRRNLDVDHCHSTGVIRSLLCGPCNRVLGFAKDNPDVLRAAASYVDHHITKRRHGEDE